MGKRKFIDKKNAVMFKLVPAIDKNNEERVLIQYVQTKNCKLSDREKQEIVRGLSNEKEFDMKKIEPPVDDRFAGIPPEILEKIRGRSDLVINQIGRIRGRNEHEEEEEDVRIEEVDEEEGEEGADEKDDAELEEEDQEYIGSNEAEEWVDDNDESDDLNSDKCDNEVDLDEVEKPSNPPVFNESDFPELPDFSSMTKEERELAEQQRTLTDEQRRLLHTVLPDDYKQMEFKGMKMKKFDDMGLPLDDGVDYSKYFSRGGGEIIASIYSDLPPVTTPDIDYAEGELPEEANEVEDVLNGGEGYEPLEDDFFIKLMQEQGAKVEIKKPAKKVAGSTMEMRVKKPKKAPKLANLAAHQEGEEVQEEKPKLPIQHAEYQQITDEQLDSAIKDFEQHKEFEGKVKFDISRNVQLGPEQHEEEEDEYVPFHELSKKDKLRFMRSHKITEPEEVQQQELEQKLNSVGHCIKPEQMHLRKIYARVPLSEDTCMLHTLQRESDSSPDEEESESDHDDIVSYRMKNSTICTNLNIIDDRKDRKPKDSNNQTIQESSVMRSMPKPGSEKRDRNETKEEKKERKERLKQFKKQRKEVKKEFMQELKQQQKTVSGNATAPLYGISRIKIQ